MAHLILDSHYDFYKLTEEERFKLVGRVFKERWFKRGAKGKIKDEGVCDTLYFPVQLTEDEGNRNYRIRQGLLGVSPIWTHGGQGKWFKVYVASPDDWDLCLEFKSEHTPLRQEVITYMKGVAKQNVTYMSILLSIQKFSFPRLRRGLSLSNPVKVTRVKPLDFAH